LVRGGRFGADNETSRNSLEITANDPSRRWSSG